MRINFPHQSSIDINVILNLLVIHPYRSIQIPGEVEADAKKGDFEVAGYAFDAAAEDLRPPRVVRVGAIQGRYLFLIY